MLVDVSKRRRGQTTRMEHQDKNFKTIELIREPDYLPPLGKAVYID